MDKLPTKQELDSRRHFQTLHFRLVTVIRSLSTKLPPQNAEKLRTFIDHLVSPPTQDKGVLVYAGTKGRRSIYNSKANCLFSEVSYAVQRFWEYQREEIPLLVSINNYIERLEWIRENWDRLLIKGNLKDGYELYVKIKRSFRLRD